MKQDAKFRKHRDRVKDYVSFFRMFGRESKGKLIATNLYCKLSGHWINGSRNDKLTGTQVDELEKKLIELREDVDSWINYIQKTKKQDQ